MNNLKYSILIIAAALFVFGGCKKDDEKSSIYVNRTGTYDFPKVYESSGYTVTPIDVTVTNTTQVATGALQVTLSGDADKFTLSATSLVSIQAGGSAAFSVAGKTGLTAGNYAATVTVSGGAVAEAQSFNVRMVVGETRTYGIEISQKVNYNFPSVAEASGYEVTPLSVTITNISNQPTGPLSIELIGIKADNFVLSVTSIDGINVGNVATFTVTAKQGLSEGTYNATVKVSGRNENIASKGFDVEMVVTKKEIYGIKISQNAAHRFPSVTVTDYAPITPLTVTVTNTGNMPTGELQITLSGTGANGFALSAPTIAGIDEEGAATFTVAPKQSLTFNKYIATVTVSGSKGIVAQSFNVEFIVNDVVFRVTTLPNKTKYGIQEPIDLTGLVIEKQKGIGPWEPYTYNPADITHDFSSAGKKTVTLLDKDLDVSVSFDVDVLTIGERVAAALGTTATIVLYANENWSGASIPVNVAASDITITTPTGSVTPRIIKRVTNAGSLFNVGTDSKLTVSGYVTLQGLATSAYGGTDAINNNNALLSVTNGGTLELKGHAKVTGNANVTSAAVQGAGIRVSGSTTLVPAPNANDSFVGTAFLIMDENAEVSGNSAVSTGGAAYSGGVQVLNRAVAYLRGNAKISNNLAQATASGNNATGGGLCTENYCIFYMEGGEISGNRVESLAQASGGAISQYNASGYVFILGGVIKDNVLKYGTSARGGAIRIGNNNRVFISNAASIIPKAGGTLDVVAKTENRNAISVNGANPGRINIFGELSASFVPILVDLESDWSWGNQLLYSCTALGDFSAAPVTLPTFAAYTVEAPAPASKFILGHLVNITTGATTSLDDREIKPNGTVGLITP